MKIGIVTHKLKDNYGGILQNFALQKCLKQLGHDPITLDLMPGRGDIYHYIRGEFRAIVSFILRPNKEKKFIIPYAPKRANACCNSFIDQHINTTHKFWDKYRPSLIKQYNLEAIIVGSDQVWRRGRKQNHPIYNMYLDFAKNANIKRIAYAASFGTDDWEYTSWEIKRCKKLIKQFDGISVRESSGIEMVKLLGRNAIQTLDPTLLLGKDGFDEILPKTKLHQEDYVAAYILDKNPKLEEMVQFLCKNQNIAKSIIFNENTIGMGPQEWIQTIRDSKFIITDSFHGSVFCILYHIPFIALVNSRRGATRFNSLLEPLGLMERLITEPSLPKAIEIVKKPIYWQHVDQILAGKRSESTAFLTQHLS